MKARSWSCSVVGVGLAIWMAVGFAVAGNVAAVNEVLKLKAAGVQEETILAFVQSKNINYDLSADDILFLRDKGLSAAVINAMLSSGLSAGRAAAGTAAPTPTAAAPAATAAPAPGPAASSAAPSNAATPAPLGAAAAPSQNAAAASGTTVPPPPPSVLPPTQLPPKADPDVAFFYEALVPHGRWILLDGTAWCWQPFIVAKTPGWRPYWDRGRWIWTDHGWYWHAEYPWGWAAFHYGRWHLHPAYGWVWFPDRVWGPAWVVWRTSGEYCGWAPLPPGAVYDTVGARLVYRGKQVSVGFEFGLGWNHFTFCLVSDLGKPSRRLVREDLRRDLYHRSAVVVRYSVERPPAGGAPPRIINHGVDPQVIRAGKGRGPEPVRVREVAGPRPPRVPEKFDSRGRTISVYRPMQSGPR